MLGLPSVTVHPSNGNSHTPSPFIPSSRTPTPVPSSLNQTGSLGVQVHIPQLLLQLLPIINLERIVLRLPEPVPFPEPCCIMTGFAPEPLSHVQARAPLPFVHKLAELTDLWKPQDGMHMIGHQHKADTSAVRFFQQFIQHSEYNPLRVVVVQQLPPPKDRECHKVSVECVINNPARRGPANILPSA